MLLRILFICFCCFSPGSSWAENRVALVIGNSDYDSVSYLPNAAKDARDVSSTLRNLGFQVIDGFDLTQSEILSRAQEMQRRLSPEDVALFYFSGHGVQIGSENYIIPVDAFGTNAEMLRSTSVSLQTILAEMEQKADRNIVILDACRNNPFELDDKNRSIGGVARGLAKVDAGVGSFIAFSTQPGNVALDGSGENSPFTEALLRHLPSSQDDLHEVMRKVRRDVVNATQSSQIPWENSSLIDRIYLSNPGGLTSQQPSNALPSEISEPSPPKTVYTYQVSGLDPNGDGFLALRNGTTSQATRLAKMTEGTKLEFLGQKGVWFNVRTEAGLQGWAHSNWIRFIGSQSASPAENCETLWYERNAIFARNGYCFRGARGRATFSNAGCRQGVAAQNIPLSTAERREVERLLARENALNCR
ncbi:caspase family protein [Roseovarius albus]|nr:caspase family protein [Roseovarius albus]